MLNVIKKFAFIVCACGLAVVAWGCGDEEAVEPQAPTKYVKEADEAVDQYNENVEKLNQDGDKIDHELQE